jgi:hypothetical protein
MAEQDVLQPEPPGTVAAVTAPTTYDRPKAVQDAVNRALSTLRLPNTFISPGDKVVLKPNWIKEHDERTPGPDNWTHVITHPSVIEAVTRWVATRLEGSGTIVICDAPQTDSSFAKIRQYCQLDRLLERCQSDFPGTHIELLDLRPEEWHALDGVTVAKTSLPGDPAGSTRVDLGASSEFDGYSGCGNLYGASYDMRETNRHHTGGKIIGNAPQSRIELREEVPNIDTDDILFSKDEIVILKK